MVGVLTVLIQDVQMAAPLWNCLSFVVSARYRVPGCEIQEQFLCSPPYAMAPKGVIDGTCSQPLAFLSLSSGPLSSPKHSLYLLANCFLSTSHLSSWVILSSDVTLDRGSLRPPGRGSSSGRGKVYNTIQSFTRLSLTFP